MNKNAMNRNQNEGLLFDDSSLLEAVLGQQAFHISSINANCDCSAYHATEDHEAFDTQPIAASAPTAA